MPIKGSLLSTEEKETILELKRQKKPIKEIMAITGRGHSIIEKYCNLYGLNNIRPKPPGWGEKEKELAVNLYSMGKDYKYISKRLKTRSPAAVKIFLCRRRREIKNDPDKQRALKVLSFCMNPGRILQAAKDSGMYTELKLREEE